MVNIEEEFNDGSWGRLADGIVDALNLPPAPDTNLTAQQVRAVWEILPEHVQDEARCHGMSDTVFGDLAFEWMQKNLFKTSIAIGLHLPEKG